jgi:hypothetical protein
MESIGETSALLSKVAHMTSIGELGSKVAHMTSIGETSALVSKVAHMTSIGE